MVSFHNIRRLCLAAPAVGICMLATGAMAPVGATARATGGLAPAHAPRPARAAQYVPGEVVVGYTRTPSPSSTTDAQRRMGVRAVAAAAPGGSGGTGGAEVLRLPRGMSVARAVGTLRRQPGVAYAVPNFVAHAAGAWIPDDRGRTKVAGGWEKLQWNFLAADGVNAPEAWANLIADHRPGGRGVVVAVLDTGVAFRNWHKFRKSPDFSRTKFVHPCDLVSGSIKKGKCTDRYPLDREGHGTFVAGTIAESTNNGTGLTGLAYGASIMPVRVLDASGNGDATTIAKGIRYAATHGARVINLSLEFDPGVTSADIPDIIGAIRFAHRHGALVVGASGNDGMEQIAYPARAPDVVAVGATTSDKCLADYSDGGRGLALVAPGGGDDSSTLNDPNCHPGRNLPDIFQMTLTNPANPKSFGLPGDWFGTSMAAPHVSATAALVIASGVLGRHPSPQQVLTRLEQTAQPLGGSKPNENYGYGLVDAGAATAPLVATPARR